MNDRTCRRCRIGAIVTEARLLLFIADFRNVVEFEMANFAGEILTLNLTLYFTKHIPRFCNLDYIISLFYQIETYFQIVLKICANYICIRVFYNLLLFIYGNIFLLIYNILLFIYGIIFLLSLVGLKTTVGLKRSVFVN